MLASAEFPTDSVNVILGESGLGKTTLLGMISGLLAPYSGTVLFNGEKVEKERLFKDGIVSYVSVDNNVIESLTVLDNPRLFCKDQTKIDYVIKKVGLEKQSKTLARKLSRGEHLRLAFARLFLNPGQVILLDEPTANLDSKNSQEVWAMIRELAKDHNVLVSTNNKEQALGFADNVFAIEGGKIKCVKRGVNTSKPLINGKVGSERQYVNHWLLWKLSLKYAIKHPFSLFFVVLLLCYALYVSTGPLLANNVDLNSTVKSDLRRRITGDYLFAEDDDYDSANPGNKIKAAEKISSDYGQGSAIYTFEAEVQSGQAYLDDDYLLVTTYDQVKTFIGKDIYDPSYAAICDGYASEETDDGVLYEPILLDNETLDAFNKVIDNKLEIGDVVPMNLFVNSRSFYDYRYVLVDTFSVNFQPYGSSIEDHFPAVIKQESFDNQLERTSVVDWSMYDELENIDEDIQKLGDYALKDEVSLVPITFNKATNLGYPLISDSSDTARPEKYISYVGLVDPNSSLAEDNWVVVSSGISDFYNYLFFQNFVNDNYQPDVSSSVKEYL